MNELRPALTGAILARDEEETIGPCLASLSGWIDEILVLVDSATRDRTREIARAAGARVEESSFTSFAEQRERALDLATGDWVLFVDADERVTPALREEIVWTVLNPGGRAGFWIPRENVILGQIVRGGGWSPDHQLRLLRRGAAHYDTSRPVHEVARLSGPDGVLTTPFRHLNYRHLSELFSKQERYAPLAAQELRRQWGRPRLRSLVGQPVREALRRYFVLKGYRDGWRGLLLALVMAWYAGRVVWLARKAPAV